MKSKVIESCVARTRWAPQLSANRTLLPSTGWAPKL